MKSKKHATHFGVIENCSFNGLGAKKAKEWRKLSQLSDMPENFCDRKMTESFLSRLGRQN